MKPNLERLIRLRDHLLHGQLGHDEFSFEHYHIEKISVEGCKTLGCAIGECPYVFPDRWEYPGDSPMPTLRPLWQVDLELKPYSTFESGIKFFNLTVGEYQALFVPGKQDRLSEPVLEFCGNRASRKKVAANLTTFIEYHQQNGDARVYQNVH